MRYAENLLTRLRRGTIGTGASVMCERALDKAGMNWRASYSPAFAALSTSQANRARVQLERSMRKSAQDAQARTREELAAELAAMSRLHELSTELLAETQLQPLLEKVLSATIELQNADFGTVQLYDADKHMLTLVAQRGFDAAFAARFGTVDETSHMSCGRALRCGKRVIIEDMLTDGQYHPLLETAAEAGYRAQQSTPLFGRGGELIGMLSTHFVRPRRPLESELRFTDLYARHAADAIERKRSEEMLRMSEKRFRRYFNLASIGMVVTFATKRIIEVNDELCNILGYDRRELLHMTWQEITHPDDVAADEAQFSRVLAGEIERYVLGKRWITKDGRIIHSVTAARCVRHSDGTVDYLVGLVQDITRRKMAEERQAASELRFRTLIDAIPHHVWSFCPDGSVGYSNRRLESYTGLTPEEVKNGGYPALHPDDVAPVRAAWRYAFEHGTDYEMVQRIRGHHGAYRRFFCRAVPVRAENGTTIEWLGTSTDIEDRERAKEALAEARFDLSRIMRVTTMGELAASIAHEVNQPLAAIATNGEACVRWLNARPANVAEASEAALRIVRDAHRAAEIISRIRAFLKRGARQTSPTDVGEAITEAVALVQTLIRTDSVSLSVVKAPRLPRAMVDRVQLQQVILNLVLNAIESMTNVSDRRRTLDIEVKDYDGTLMCVSVSDSGTGLQHESRKHIYEPFYTSKPHGMGMGLAISRSIVEAHGGRLWATSNAGPGTTFEFTLPIAETACTREHEQ
jgi:PAS domain S-box-containing protein